LAVEKAVRQAQDAIGENAKPAAWRRERQVIVDAVKGNQMGLVIHHQCFFFPRGLSIRH